MVEPRSLASIILIALGCAGTLAAVNLLTRDRIQANETAALRRELAALLPAQSALPATLPDLTSSPAGWALCDGTLLGYSATPGYGGPIRLIFTLSSEQPTTLYRLRLLSHQETPGITDFLRDPEGWLTEFNNRTTATLAEVSAVSGATITTRAIQSHLSRVLENPTDVLGAAATTDCHR